MLLIDQRDRTYLFRLEVGGTFHTHSGTLAHDSLIGASEGTRLETSRGMVLMAYRARFADFVLKMPRGAQVVYPKDVGPIVIYADVFPGARVLEAGTGSGALTIALCRAVGNGGAVVSYELRDEHRNKAVANIETFFGKLPDVLELRRGDLTEVSGTGERFDRAVLDLPEPWATLPALAEVLDPEASPARTFRRRCRCSNSCLRCRAADSNTSRRSRRLSAAGTCRSAACGPTIA